MTGRRIRRPLFSCSFCFLLILSIPCGILSPQEFPFYSVYIIAHMVTITTDRLFRFLNTDITDRRYFDEL
ncbi:hypothetical protein CLOSTHATH_01182 [Hungatella hathewayi DSM 13479]|uniref:Uncharacterized protein n=1 Tax=Hungatella hathewayi DSM 13479 TaxID=566550 RepID=D3AC53_9FIRM|nr:hypothetical protein CLOSTHATH_01182 [Hungatella hathewayi DSM 13479]